MVKFAVFCTKVVAASFAAVMFSSCHTSIDLGNGIDGNGNVTRQTRNVSDFTKVDVNRGLNVTLEQSDSFFVEVEADDNLQSHISTKVENGTLVITTDENIDEATAKNIHVKAPSLTKIETSSGSSVTTKSVFRGTDMAVKSSSGSESSLDLEFDNISCESSSGSSITVRGKALKLTTDSSSGSEIEAKHLLVNDVVSESTSGSSTGVHPLVSLNGKASSGSSINYDGSPKTVTKEESSGGSVSKE
ncbi:head GIN domain-containing protein [Flavobacterium wongokense]|uniref:head GIN domain-containing protein n=1 Tax=Flavobacterium wongokense TaxID=2910674 RepID=UPI001F271C32|nr:head GIN domain-containing protein [Flavobacterium sp. WG47]MCF6132308.1 DUF2807 domain-containing protein [Flavobacterium sp. WG47]